MRPRSRQPPYDLVGDDLLLALHVAGHIAFYVVLLVHAGIAVRRPLHEEGDR